MASIAMAAVSARPGALDRVMGVQREFMERHGDALEQILQVFFLTCSVLLALPSSIRLRTAPMPLTHWAIWARWKASERAGECLGVVESVERAGES